MVCHKQGPKIEGVILLRVGILGLSLFYKTGSDFVPSAAPLYPNTGQVPPPPGGLYIVVTSNL